MSSACLSQAKTSQKFYENNFNYIRLFLAIEVLMHHLDNSFIEKYLFYHQYFPGVPGFFFVSGFLIFASFDRLRNIRKFYLNRFLRIYPALVIISLLSFLYVSYINYYHFNNNYFFENFTWFLSQITFFQYYRHNYLEYSVNWVTWTITIEIIFYIITPALFYFKNKEKLLILLIILSFILFSFSINNSFHPLIYNSPLIWGWMLFMGSLFYLYFEKIYKYKSFFIYLLAPFFLIIYFQEDILNQFNNNFLIKILIQTNYNSIGLINFIFYIFLIFWAAYFIRLPKFKTDLSYSIYLSHTFFFAFCWGILGYSSSLLIITLTMFYSFLSWNFVEKKILYKKF